MRLRRPTVGHAFTRPSLNKLIEIGQGRLHTRYSILSPHYVGQWTGITLQSQISCLFIYFIVVVWDEDSKNILFSHHRLRAIQSAGRRRRGSFIKWSKLNIIYWENQDF